MRRYGEAIFPVDVLVTFANGERVTEHWDGSDRWKLYTYDRPARGACRRRSIRTACCCSTSNYTNNSRTLEPQGRRGGDEVVAEVDGVAAGLPAVVGGARMSAFAAWRDGIRRVNRAPAILVGVWALTLLVSLPLALALRGMLAQHLGASLAADTAAARRELRLDAGVQRAGDRARRRRSSRRSSASARCSTTSARFLDDTQRPVVIVGAAAVYVVLWIFVAGGIIDRYARDRATRAHGFFAACGRVLLPVPAAGRGAVDRLRGCCSASLHPWLFDRLYPRLTREMTVERTAFVVRVGAVSRLRRCWSPRATMLFDYAKVRAVVEDRRSMLGAIDAAAGFIRRNAGAAVGAVPAELRAVRASCWRSTRWSRRAPAAAGCTMWLGFGVGQVYVLARLWVKLVFWASETALFQGRLGARRLRRRAREPAWPDSPAADAI